MWYHCMLLDSIIIILRCWTLKPSLPAQFVLSLSSLYPGSHLHSTHFVQRESMLQLKKHFPKMQYLECWIHCCKHPPLSTLHNFCFFAIRRKEDKNRKGSLRFSYIGRRALGTFNKFKFRYIRCTYHLHPITGHFGQGIIWKASENMGRGLGRCNFPLLFLICSADLYVHRSGPSPTTSNFMLLSLCIRFAPGWFV